MSLSLGTVPIAAAISVSVYVTLLANYSFARLL